MSQSLSKLLELNPLHLPEAPSWWPLAWGSLSLIGVIVLVIVIVALFIRWRIKRLIPKKTALKLFQRGGMSPSDAIELVRQAAFCYYPRKDIAHLTGNDWYAFLDSQYGKPLFTPNAALWQAVLYQHEKVNSDNEHQLIDSCVSWVQESLPPKKNRR